MEELMLSESEHRLMDVIWRHAPIESGKLVKVCEAELNWKKSTTYTMLRKLIAKQTFGGSLPSFLLSFLEDKSLSDSEADELIKIIEDYRNEK